MDKLVSILIPVFNREEIISETIESALNQSYDNIEVIVVDNASTDGTWDQVQNIAKSDTRVRAFRNETNLGPVRNWRRCVDEARGYFAKILWSDDLIAPDFLEKCLPLMDDETCFVYSGVKIFTDNPDQGEECYFFGRSGHMPSSLYIRRALQERHVPVSPGCALFRLKDVKENLLVDVDTRIDSDFSMHAIGNDLLLFLLTAKNYKKFGFISEPLSFFRSHPGSISISSGNGKLPLHYMMVRTYFAELYQHGMVSRLAAKVWLMLKKYPGHRDFGIENVKDFFHGDVKVNYFIVSLILLDRSLRVPARIVRKIYRTLEVKK